MPTTTMAARQCFTCGGMVFDGNYEEIDNRVVCTTCVREGHGIYYCAQCETVHTHVFNPPYNVFEEQWCYSCFDEGYMFCAQCDSVVARENITWIEEEGYCYDCADRRNSMIRSYHAMSKTRKFFGSGEWYFGIELEVQNMNKGWSDMNEDAKNINAIFEDGLLFFEMDSSVNSGYEIVTAPMSLEYFTENESKFTDMLNYLRENGYKSHNTDCCGMHIHVGYDAFGSFPSERDFNMTKLLYVYEKFFDDILTVSRRTASAIERWAGKYGTENMCNLDSYVKAPKHQQEKYRAINLRNEYTLEFRAFRGTLKEDVFFGTVYLTVRLIERINEMTLNNIAFCNTLRGILKPDSNDAVDKLLTKFDL